MDLRSMASLYEEALSAAREEGPSAVREHSVSNHSALPDERTLQLLLLEGVFGTSFTDDSGRFTFWISGTGINPPDRTF